MSDLFKRHQPKLSEEEERALWERVRTMPRDVGGESPARAPGAARRPWWATLWAVPAVRFGAPVLAVALVAVTWVVQQSPTPPTRPGPAAQSENPGLSQEETPPTEEGAVSPDPDMAYLAAPEPTPPAPGRRDRSPVDEKDRALPGTGEPRQTSSATPPQEVAENRVQVIRGASRAPDPMGESSSTGGETADRLAAGGVARPGAQAMKAAPAPPPEVYGTLKNTFRRENPRVGEIQSVPPVVIDLDRFAAVLDLARGEILFETVRLPLDGGMAWIVAGPVSGDLRFVRGREGNAGAVLPLVHGRLRVLRTPDGTVVEFVGADGDVRPMPAPGTTARARRAALGVELLWSNRSSLEGLRAVRGDAGRLVAERPGDAGARALLAWCDDLIRQREAFERR